MLTLKCIEAKVVECPEKEVPYRLIDSGDELSAGNPDAVAISSQWRNLDGLKAHLPPYRGPVKCVLADLSWNTRQEARPCLA